MKSDETADLRCRKCRPPRIKTPGIIWMEGPRIAAFVDRLSAAESSTADPPPAWVSFKWLANWCARDGSPIVNNQWLMAAYRQLLNSFLAGSFQTTRVSYLSKDASAYLSGPVVAQLGLTLGSERYKMTAQFLKARAKAFSRDNPTEMTALFDAYLAPCWIRRSVAVRWLENNRYPLPSQSPAAATGTVAPPSAKAINSVRREAPTRDRVMNLMRADIDSGAVTIEQLRQKKEAWAARYQTSVTTTYEAAKKLEAELKAEAEAASRS